MTDQEIRRINTELQRSDAIGDDMAAFIDARSRAEENLEEIKTALLEQILPAVVLVMEGVESGTKVLVAIKRVGEDLMPDGVGAGLKDFIQWLSTKGIPIFELVLTLMAGPFAILVKKKLDEMDKETDAPWLKELEDFLNPGKFMAEGKLPPAPPGFGGMGMP